MAGLFITLGVLFIGWMGYTAWSAPLMRENEDGSWTTIKPQRKFSELFKKRSKSKSAETPMSEFADKEAFQKMAGIIPHETGFIKEVSPRLTDQTNNKIFEALMKAAEMHEFPEQDTTIPIRTEKITTIQRETNEDNDPLASIPMSRVSREAKLRIAEIAKEDINRQLETQISNIHPALKAEFDKELEEANKIMLSETKPKVRKTKKK